MNLDTRFIKPINWFLRIAFILFILYKHAGVVTLLYTHFTYPDYIEIAEMYAGSGLFQSIFVFLLFIVGFVSTFGISRSKEWGRKMLIGVASLLFLFNLYVVFNIFIQQIRDNFDSAVVDLSSIYFKLALHIILCGVSGATIYYFTRANVRNIFKIT